MKFKRKEKNLKEWTGSGWMKNEKENQLFLKGDERGD